MSIFRNRKKTAYRIAACIIAAMITISPAAAGMQVYAEERAEEEKEQKKDRDDAGKESEEGSTQESTEAAGVEEPGSPESEESQKEDPAHPESSVREALENERAMVADDDILLIRIGYEFDDGSFDEWMRGTGFIVGPRYILTRQSLIDTASDSALFARIVKERGEAYKRVGINLLTGEDAAKHVTYYVSDRAGNRIEISDSSMKSGLGLLVTKKTMDIPACVFSKVNVDDLAEGTVIHAKTAADTGEKFSVRTFDGTVYIDEEQAAGFAFQMDTQGGAPIGAPVYDDNGHVIGLVASDAQDLTSFSEKALEAFLSMNGVDFRSSDASAAALAEALEKAKSVDVREDASQKEVDDALDALNVAYEGLTSKVKFSGFAGFMDGPGRIIIGVVAIFVGMLGAAVVMAKKRMIRPGKLFKRKKVRNVKDVEEILRELSEEERGNLEYADDEFADMTRREKDRDTRIPRDKGKDDLEYADEDEFTEDEATDLEADSEDGSSDTTVLTRKAYLIRLSSGKRIPISKKDFVIGKEKGKVDYCISGEPTVSRVHALIRNIGGKYYIEDQASTNYTYYEGKQIPEYKAVYLEDGRRFKLSDVEFEFHLGRVT